VGFSDWLAQHSGQVAGAGASTVNESNAFPLKSYKRVFDAFDLDGDQQLSLSEFQALCGALKAAAAEEVAEAGQDKMFENFLRVLGSRGR
jgi:hypothetical protein